MATDLKQQWQTLCANYTSDTNLVTALWQELQQAYTSTQRHYHNLDHLAYMLKLAEKYKPETVQYDLLQLAIFYHDVVYDATRADNEEKSAELEEKYLTALGVPSKAVACVKGMIIATKTHQQQQDTTTNFLLDLDLAILGASWQRYDTYRQAIRKEYSHYPETAYRSGRKSVLQRFLAQPHIYKTPYFRDHLELQAR